VRFLQITIVGLANASLANPNLPSMGADVSKRVSRYGHRISHELDTGTIGSPRPGAPVTIPHTHL